MKTAVYSAVYGGYDKPRPADFGATPAYMYTDDPALSVPGWEMRYRPLPNIATGMLRAKWWKLHPLEAAPDVDISIWLDGSLNPRPGYVEKCLGALGGDEWAMMPHPWRDCIYDEVAECIAIPKYDPEALRRQAAHYRRLGHPEHWGLFATGTNCRRHTRRVEHLGEMWWVENTTRSYQDQVSLPVLVRGAPLLRWNTNIPWCDWWGLTPHGM